MARLASIARIGFVLLLARGMAGQELLSLAEANRRLPPDFVPAHLGETVEVEGVVSFPPVRIREYSHLVIQDTQGAGLTLEAPIKFLAEIQPGEVLRARGVVGHRSGLPILETNAVRRVRHAQPPAPRSLTISQLSQFESLSLYVVCEGSIIGVGQNSGGDVLRVGGSGASLMVFLPRQSRAGGPGLRDFAVGDRVRIEGISSQYAPGEPYDTGFEIVVPAKSAVILLDRRWMVPPDVLSYIILTLAVALSIWWVRERSMARQRSVMRGMMNLSEDILASFSPVEISRKLQATLPGVLNASTVEMYVLGPGSNALELVPSEPGQEPLSVNTDSPIGLFPAAVALCLRNRALLDVPDARRSPILDANADPDLPRAAVFIPMFAGGEVLGVLAIKYRTPHRTNREQQAALQHFGNQIGAALKLQEQQSMREQLLRSEKLAAAGQLISDVATDLRAPLTAITNLAERTLQTARPLPEELQEIADHAQRGVELVNHVVSFARMEQGDPKSFDLFALASGLIALRQSECSLKGVRLESQLPLYPAYVMASRSQIERTFLSLVIHAEHAAAAAPEKVVVVTGRVIGKKVQLAIDHSGNSDLATTDLTVWQAVAQTYNGDARRGATYGRLEFELPLHQPASLSDDEAASPSRRASRILTAAVLEADATGERRLVTMLGGRGHRVIPVSDGEEAADVLQRFQFDVLFCTARPSGVNWVELFGRVRRKVDTFVLLMERDASKTKVFPHGDGYVLLKPVQEEELDNLLDKIEARARSRK